MHKKAWFATDRSMIIWKSNLSDKVKSEFFQVVAVSVLLYGCTTGTLKKLWKKKPDSNYTRMLHAVLNKSLKQYHLKQLLYGHLPPISQTIQVRQTRDCWWSKNELISNALWWTHQCWQACKDLHSSTLCGHWMQFRGPAKRNGQLGQMVRENQGNLCYQYNLMMMMMIESPINKQST